MLLKLNIIAFIVVCGMAAVALWQRRKFHNQQQGRSQIITLVVAVLAAISWTMSFNWHFESTMRVVGFPFTAAAFELPHGYPVVETGVLAWTALIGNYVFWYLLFQIAAIYYLRVTTKPQQIADGKTPETHQPPH